MNPMIKAAICRNFINPLNVGIKDNLRSLKKININHEETKSLLRQVNKTLNNSNSLLKRNNFIDSNSLLRSSIEYLAMAMLIEENEDIYNEYIDLYPEERNFTAPTKLVKKFGGKLKTYSSVLFDDTNRNERTQIMYGIYDTLCSYTHSTLLIPLFDNIKDQDIKNIMRLLMYMNHYFVKIIYYACLKYLTKNENEYIDYYSLVLSYLFYCTEIVNLIKEKNIDFSYYNKFLHIDDKNIGYIEQYKNQVVAALGDFDNIELTDEQKKLFEKSCKVFLGIEK